MTHLRAIGTSLLATSTLVVGCNTLFGVDQLSFDGAAAGGDGGTAAADAGATGGSGGEGGAGAAGGVGGAGGPYPELGAFGAASPVTAINSTDDDDDPTFTADMGELYFNSKRGDGGDADIWMSPGVGGTEMWGTPLEITGLNSPQDDSNPVVAPDGLTFWLASRRDSADYEIYVSTRANRVDKWSAPELVPELNSSASDFPSAVSPNGLTFWLTSGRLSGTTNTDLFVTTRSLPSTEWSAPEPLSELNTQGSDNAAWLRADGLEIYFGRSTANEGGELLRALRPTAAVPFGAPVPVIELNSSEAESDPWLSLDRRYIMFVRGPSPRTIWQASR